MDIHPAALPVHPAIPPVRDNPLLALAGALVYALLYLLGWARAVIAFATITVPTTIVRILGYSLTLQLNFRSLAVLFGLGVGVVFFLVRYRFLNKYSELKEVPLAPPDRHLLNPTLSNPDFSARPTAFHNYLDEFLAAIRIFGFLEKPVFHELSRHLQTKRLIAGDSIGLGKEEQNFYCVVDGNVQVFALANEQDGSAARAAAGPYNGYYLLNEVGSGGTLSSLFTILSLFTEDIKLAWAERSPTDPDGSEAGEQDEGGVFERREAHDGEVHGMPGLRRKGRTNSDVSQLDVATLGEPRGAMGEDSPSIAASEITSATAPSTILPHAPPPINLASSIGSPDFVARRMAHLNGVGADGQPHSASMPVTSHPSPALSSSFPSRRRARERSAANEGPSGLAPRARMQDQQEGTTIGRATVDTTLAVIPAEAFKRLTRLFPKASGHIVSVILTRFSRVTFMTAHKYLGLTREVLQAEDSLNAYITHPLPRAFYEQGGMQKLRERFQPELKPLGLKASPKGSARRMSVIESDGEGTAEGGGDYFDYQAEHRPPSLSSTTPRGLMTPAATVVGAKRKETLSMTSMAAPTPVAPPAFSRHSTSRQRVGAGDLMSMTPENDSSEGSWYRPSRTGGVTPGLPRQDTARWSSSVRNVRSSKQKPKPPRWDDSVDAKGGSADETFNLRDAVMTSIAQSIGLLQPANANGVPLSAASMPGTPSVHASQRHAGSSRSPFGSLSMIDLLHVAQQGNPLGVGDEESSVNGTTPESVMDGKGQNLLEDLGNEIEILYFPAGSTLVKAGETHAGLFYVIDGFLDVSMPAAQNDTVGGEAAGGSKKDSAAEELLKLSANAFGSAGDKGKKRAQVLMEHLFTVKPGGIAGYLASLCGIESYVSIQAKTDCYVGHLPHKTLENLLERKPIVLLTMAKRLISLLSPLILHIDSSLDWMQLNAGQVLYNEGDASDSFYIVINGRLRSLNEQDSGQVDLVAEYGQGDCIGELDAITGAKRPHTLHAIRDSELVRMPIALFNAISIRHPATTIQFLRLIASRMKQASSLLHRSLTPGTPGPVAQKGGNTNLKTVCILPATRNVPIAAFATKLRNALEDIGAPTSYLDQASVMRQLGRHAFSKMGKLKVANWLADQEQRFRIVLYVVDTPVTSQWTLTSVRQADFVLVVSMGDDPSLGEYEKFLLASKTTARRELVLLHPERSVASGSTRRWLKERPWISAHHHVELPGIITPGKSNVVEHDPAAVAAFKHLREQVETRIKKYRGLRPLTQPRRPPHMNDFARLARRLCGKSIGLVLGGGGARGISHLGMLQALEEAQVPVDAIGGCSIGSFIGGLYARETDLLSTAGRAKQFSGRMGSMWRILSDVTYPFAAYTTGHEFNRGIYKAFYDVHLEDMWIPYFCNSTNITHSRMDIHRTGYAWRYVRASMTLAGLLPPLSDDGNLLVDGGYIDNLPVETMMSIGPATVIAVDVGSIDDTRPRRYGDSVSGFAILFKRLNPFNQLQVLSMTEVSSRLTYVASVGKLGDVKATPGCLYFAMPVQAYDTLGFGKFTEIMNVGLKAGREVLAKWKDEGRLPSGLVDDVKAKQAISRGTKLRRMSI